MIFPFSFANWILSTLSQGTDSLFQPSVESSGPCYSPALGESWPPLTPPCPPPIIIIGLMGLVGLLELVALMGLMTPHCLFHPLTLSPLYYQLTVIMNGP